MFWPDLITYVGIDNKQPLSPASGGVGGGNQEYKDDSEEHDASLTVVDTQEENWKWVGMRKKFKRWDMMIMKKLLREVGKKWKCYTNAFINALLNVKLSNILNFFAGAANTIMRSTSSSYSLLSNQQNSSCFKRVAVCIVNVFITPFLLLGRSVQIYLLPCISLSLSSCWQSFIISCLIKRLNLFSSGECSQ